MENLIGSFCESREYGSVSKKLKATDSNVKIEKFVQYVTKNRGKRKSTLSFEVRVCTGELFFFSLVFFSATCWFYLQAVGFILTNSPVQRFFSDH